MRPKNLLIIMSDQHSRTLMGCYGHALVRTPNLDRLAARGTRFTECWTPSPVCIPARASFATGKYIHQIGFWDNADPYDGSVPSWHHRLREAGHQVVSIGKLNFPADEDDSGFSESIIPMQVFAQGAHHPAEPVAVVGLDTELARPAAIEEIIVTFWQLGLLDEAGVVGGDENVQACADPLPVRQDCRRKERR